jgi:predicted aspartyl protease
MRRLPSCLAPLLLSAAACAHAGDAGSCRYTPIADLPITLSGASNLPLIDGSINGAPATMLVDTGSTISLIMQAATEKRHLALDATGKYVMGVNGATPTFRVKVNDFAVGAIHSGRVGMPVIGSAGMAKVRYDAIVGAEFLLQADMEIALSGKMLKFYRASDCRDTFLAYWDAAAMEIPFARSDERHLNPTFEVTINGKPLTAMIDTGAGTSYIGQAAAERAGVSTTSPGVTAAGKITGVGDDKVNRWNATFASFTLGSETIENASLAIMEAPPTGRPPFDVILGRDFLRAHRVLFAMSQDRLYVSYTGGEVFAKPSPAVAAAPAAPGIAQ